MKRLFLIQYFLITVIIAYLVFPMLGLLIFVWTSIGFYIVSKGKQKSLIIKNRYLFYFFLLSYPVIEILIKYIIINNSIAYSWNILNRIEHFLFAVGITILLFPAVKSTLRKLCIAESAVFIVSFVCLLGIFNEIVEYLFRVWWGLTDVGHFSGYYWDTIYDLIVNFAGSIFGFVVLHLSEIKRIITRK